MSGRLESSTNERVVEGLVKIFCTSKTMALNDVAYMYNVIDPRFCEFHAFFCELLKEMIAMDERIAKRLRSLNVLVPGTPTEFTRLTLVQDHPGLTDANQMLQNLINDGQILCKFIIQQQKVCEEVKDLTTLNLLTEIEECLGQMAWKVRSHVGHQPVSFEQIKGLDSLKVSAQPARGREQTTATH